MNKTKIEIEEIEVLLAKLLEEEKLSQGSSKEGELYSRNHKERCGQFEYALNPNTGSSLRPDKAYPKFWELISDAIGDIDPFADAYVEMLIDCGANPLLGKKGLTAELTDGQWSMTMSFLTGLSRSSTGQTCRREDGSNPLHVMAEGQTSIFFTALAGALSKAPERWLNGQRDDGATPLHVLWRRPKNALDSNNPALDRLTHDIWSVTSSMMKQGADLALKDDNGVAVFELITSVLARGVVPDPMFEEAAQVVRMMSEQVSLENITPGVARKSQGMRL